MIDQVIAEGPVTREFKEIEKLAGRWGGKIKTRAKGDRVFVFPNETKAKGFHEIIATSLHYTLNTDWGDSKLEVHIFR